VHFSRDPFDTERYQEIAAIARAMLARLGNAPLTVVEELFADIGSGYATPRVDVRGAVFEGDRVLLVRERSDGRWTLPGGYADVGISAGDNVVKEIREEAGIVVRAASLYGIRHKARHEYDPDPRDFYKLFFLCERLDDVAPVAGMEVMDVGFFALDELPPLSTGRVLVKDIHAAAAHRADPGRAPHFD
jgi:ADP-ribose pyrophosphatase YjhB (NUDIX family)